MLQAIRAEDSCYKAKAPGVKDSGSLAQLKLISGKTHTAEEPRLATPLKVSWQEQPAA